MIVVPKWNLLGCVCVCVCGTTRGKQYSASHVFDLSVLEAQERHRDRLGRFPGGKDTLMLL